MKQDNISELAQARENVELLSKKIKEYIAIGGTRAYTEEEETDYDNTEVELVEAQKVKAKLERDERAKGLISGTRSTAFGAPGIKINRKACPQDYTDGFKAFSLNTPQTRSRILDDWKRSADLIGAQWESNQWQLRAQSSDVAGEGKEFTNDGIYRGFVEAKQAYGGMLEISNVQELPSAESVRYVTDNDTGNIAKKHTTQNETIVNVGVANIDDVTITPKIYSTSVFPVSIQLLRDGRTDVQSWIGRKLGRRLLKKINIDLTANLASAVTIGAFGVSDNLGYQDLGDLYFSVDPDYVVSPKCVFMGNHATKAHLWSQFADPNAGPTWGNGLNGQPLSEVLGTRYITNQQCDSMSHGVSKQPLFFGDFDAFTVHTVGTPTLVRMNELYMETLSVGFMLYWEVDGKLVDAGTHPIKSLQTGTISGG